LDLLFSEEVPELTSELSPLTSFPVEEEQYTEFACEIPKKLNKQNRLIFAFSAEEYDHLCFADTAGGNWSVR